MNKGRKFLIFLIAGAMLVGGLYLLAGELLVAHTIYFRFVIAGAMLVVLGGYLLWADIFAPMLGIKTAED
jgi:hypothetical protein